MKSIEILAAVALLLGFAFLIELAVDELRARFGIFHFMDGWK